ncbi:MAG TPA: KH domain-containing protein [Thermomicrobiales bacterium]|nr:KH domain-containing protein [Thermomicrobiales bacterium]
MEQLERVVDYIATGLVDHPEAVQVDSRRHGQTVSLHLHVAPEELGRVIGKQGRIAKAMRTMLGIAAAQQGLRASLEIEG